MSFLTFLIFFSTLSFIFFGIGCFVTPKMKLEFKRYGLENYRTTVGGLQLLGSLALLCGYFYAPFLQVIGAGGLSVLMVLGFLVRLKIKDSFLLSAPSLLYSIINGFIFFKVLFEL
ncbi:DoxX family protein [Patiriisocius sp. Uisw_017]|jgi:hypothetical protein|uniref:DoxX family protein n=1 Tax=Patiriisocius sp. Uisw_017 TaxID=3230968 RepID=UPI0039EBBF98